MLSVGGPSRPAYGCRTPFHRIDANLAVRATHESPPLWVGSSLRRSLSQVGLYLLTRRRGGEDDAVTALIGPKRVVSHVEPARDMAGSTLLINAGRNSPAGGGSFGKGLGARLLPRIVGTTRGLACADGRPTRPPRHGPRAVSRSGPACPACLPSTSPGRFSDDPKGEQVDPRRHNDAARRLDPGRACVPDTWRDRSGRSTRHALCIPTGDCVNDRASDIAPAVGQSALGGDRCPCEARHSDMPCVLHGPVRMVRTRGTGALLISRDSSRVCSLYWADSIRRASSARVTPVRRPS
jgi:hypothetical protein